MTTPRALATSLALLSPWILALSSYGCGPVEPMDEEDWIAQSGWPVHTVCGQNPTTTFGIDVSKWQGTVNWPAVKADGVVFAIVRVSDGTQTLDEQFEANWKGTKAAGIIRGAYQFFRPAQSATDQAALFVEKIEQAGGFEPGDLPGVIDVESMGGVSSAQAIQAVGAWIEYVEQHTGRRPIIYSGSYFWDDNSLGGNFSDYPLWTAHYTSAACPLVSSEWDRWTFWQYTDKGSVAGISGGVDENRFDGNLAQLQAFIAESVIGGEPDAGPDAEPDAGPDAAPDAAPDVVPDVADEPDESDSGSGGAGPDTDAGTVEAGGTPSGSSYYRSEEPEGCACRVGSPTHATSAWWGLVGIGVLLMRRGRRTATRW